MTNHQVEHESRGDRGRFFIKLDGGAEAIMTYVQTAPQVATIDHTLVPPQFRGQNIAETLAVNGVTELANQGNKIVPQCSYVAKLFERRKDWAVWLA